MDPLAFFRKKGGCCQLSNVQKNSGSSHFHQSSTSLSPILRTTSQTAETLDDLEEILGQPEPVTGARPGVTLPSVMPDSGPLPSQPRPPASDPPPVLLESAPSSAVDLVSSNATVRRRAGQPQPDPSASSCEPPPSVPRDSAPASLTNASTTSSSEQGPPSILTRTAEVLYSPAVMFGVVGGGVGFGVAGPLVSKFFFFFFLNFCFHELLS